MLSVTLYKQINFNNFCDPQQRMWTFMETTRPSVFVKNTKEGVERVLRSNGQYAFFMESTSIEFFTERRCDLTQIGFPMDSKGYGIAMRPGRHYLCLTNKDNSLLYYCPSIILFYLSFRLGSPFRAALSQAVLKMQETNRLLILKKKWWAEMRGGGACKVRIKQHCYVKKERRPQYLVSEIG